LKTTEIQHWDIERLSAYERNPRKNDHAVEKVAQAIREFGFRIPIIAKSSGEVVDGHLRLKAAKHLGMSEVPVLLADDMTDVQVKAFRISVNKMAELADWDDDLLKLELDELQEMNFDLDLTGFEIDTPTIEVDPFISSRTTQSSVAPKSDNPYTKKIVAPIYEIKGDCPTVQELCDDSRAKSLISDINNANLPEDVAEFLRQAAQRHTIFNFAKIAEFYAHADTDTQRLMEDSALVIIDFNKAIELGYARLTDTIAEQYLVDSEDYDDEG